MLQFFKMPPQTIFKPYDIRGIYPGEINEKISRKLGRSFAAFIKSYSKKSVPEIVVGMDSRSSSEALLRSLAEGLLAEGARVRSIGLVSSPMHLFGVVHLGADAGIMITASHNPKEYNGFKFTLGNGESIGEDSGLRDIQATFDALKDDLDIHALGGVEKIDLVDRYVDFLLKDRVIDSSLKVVADSGNGAVGAILPTLRRKSSFSAIPLFSEPDGSFPNRSPDPTSPGAMRFTQAAVREQNADLGVVFDADGDRAVFVDERGEEVDPNLITALLAEYFLEKSPGEKIWYDAVSSKIVPESIAGAGGVPVVGRVGRVRAKAAMKECNCLFGGEHSAHYYFRDYFFSDSALLTLLYVMEILSSKKQKLSALLKKFERYVRSGEMNFKIKEKESLLEEIKKVYSHGKFNVIDGITVEFGDWWFNIRPSNTEPLIRLNIEAEDSARLDEEKKRLVALIERFR